MFRISIKGLAVVLAVQSVAPLVMAQTAYQVPATEPGEDGWLNFQGAMVLNAQTASGLSPDPTSPEAAVVRFLASQLRGDRDWQDSMVDDLDRRGRNALAAWDDWTLVEAQLVARKNRGEDRLYVRVRLDLLIDGESESGTDDFEVVRDGDGWRIKQPPA